MDRLIHKTGNFLIHCFLKISCVKLTAVIFVCCGLLLFQSNGGCGELDDEIRSFENLSNVYHLILRDYIVEKDRTSLVNSAIEGMIKSLDPYSDLLSKEEMDNLELTSVGKYSGIGINMQMKDDLFIVTQVYKSSPAEKAGLLPGDVLVKVNDVQLTGKSDVELHRILQGKTGTDLKVGFYHDNNPEKVIVKVIKKDWILTNSVEYFESDSNIGVLRIFQFIKQTPKEIRSYLSGKRLGAIILDLRNNPGGLLLSAVESAEQFISMGPIVETRSRNNRVIEKYISHRVFKEDRPFLIVMINRYSASAAEILAGAIQDRKEGIIIGEKSFGKGVVQSIYPLDNEIFVKLTTAKYFTPGGVSFHQKGIQPDIEVADTPSTQQYDSSDKIFQKALDLARSKLN